MSDLARLRRAFADLRKQGTPAKLGSVTFENAHDRYRIFSTSTDVRRGTEKGGAIAQGVHAYLWGEDDLEALKAALAAHGFEWTPYPDAVTSKGTFLSGSMQVRADWSGYPLVEIPFAAEGNGFDLFNGIKLAA